MIIRNTIPFYTFTIEYLVGLLAMILAIMLTRKYLERRKIATLYLALTFVMQSLAALINATGKAMDYFSPVPRTQVSYTDFATILAFACTAFATILLMGFFAHIFNQTTKETTFLLIFLNAITVGLFLSNLSFTYRAYRTLIPYVLYHIVVSIIIYSLIIYESQGIKNRSKNKVVKIGFSYIQYFGVFYILSFVFFLLDASIGQINHTSFTVFYFMGWISMILAAVSAYLGYGMPTWFKARILNARDQGKQDT